MAIHYTRPTPSAPRRAPSRRGRRGEEIEGVPWKIRGRCFRTENEAGGHVQHSVTGRIRP